MFKKIEKISLLCLLTYPCLDNIFMIPDVFEPLKFYCSYTEEKVQWNCSGSNTDGSFTTAVSNSFLSPLEKNPTIADLGYNSL